MENLKTKYQFINAAKTLFVRKGYDDTTMIDIAEEAGLSRRTLYSYFESKVEVFQAVVNNEVEKILAQLSDIAKQNMPVQQKIVEFIFGYFRLVKETVDRNGTLRSGFFRNAWGLEHFRKAFDLKQKQMLQDIISEGKTTGVFDVVSVRRTAEIMHNCMRGFEAPYIRGKLWQGNTREEIRFEARRLIYGALGYSNLDSNK
jgi:AcrR family transcriptional regulator